MKEANYIGKNNSFISRLKSIYRILFYRNYILVNYTKTDVVDNKAKYKVKVINRTDYNTQSDINALKVAINMNRKDL